MALTVKQILGISWLSQLTFKKSENLFGMLQTPRLSEK